MAARGYSAPFKVFEDFHIEAALSIIRVHSRYFITKIPGAALIGWGGAFVDKINRIEMLYSIEKMPISSDFYAILLFSFLEDLNLHEERFGPYLATVPVSPDEYELRLVLPDYHTLSPKESPKAAFIFNIGDIIFICHREQTSKSLQVFKKERFSSIIDAINKTSLEQDPKDTALNG